MNESEEDRKRGKARLALILGVGGRNVLTITFRLAPHHPGLLPLLVPLDKADNLDIKKYCEAKNVARGASSPGRQCRAFGLWLASLSEETARAEIETMVKELVA